MNKHRSSSQQSPTESRDGACGPDCACLTDLVQLKPGDGHPRVPDPLKAIYLDHAATTQVRPEVIDAMLPYFAASFGNASSIHSFGRTAKEGLEDARATVAARIGALPAEIYFTSGGTESDNLAIAGIARAGKRKGKHLLTSQIEHSAVHGCCKYLENEGFEVEYLPVDRFGTVDLHALAETIRPDTILVSLMSANNETGTLQPVADAVTIAHAAGVPVHTDAVQAVGKIPLDVGELGVDLVSFSAHKIYGPKGVGGLYVRRGTGFAPLVHGGHQERMKRPGTEAVPSIVGFARALELAIEEMARDAPRLTKLRDRLEHGIREKLPRAQLNGHPERRLPNILNMSFEFLEGESLLLALDSRGIAVSTGSACTSGTLLPSHVLRAMGRDLALAKGAIRFSLGRDNTETEIDFVVDSLAEVVDQLCRMSPLQMK